MQLIFFPLFVTLGAMVFSLALVDFPQVSDRHRADFNRHDLLWMSVVALSIGWPVGMIYMVPYWEAAVLITLMTFALTCECLWPSSELRKWQIFKQMPKSAWFLLAFFSILSTWCTFLHLWVERARGIDYVGLLNLGV